MFVSQEINVSFFGNVSGIVGMGYSTTSNFLDLAYKAGSISTNVFTLQLGTTPNTSIMYYNSIPSTILSNNLYTSLYGNAEWSLNLIGVYANNTDLTSYSSNIAVVDSGTSLFYLLEHITVLTICQFILTKLSTTNKLLSMQL